MLIFCRKAEFAWYFGHVCHFAYWEGGKMKTVYQWKMCLARVSATDAAIELANIIIELL